MREDTRKPGKDFWHGCRALVTGATGVIGSWLVKELLARRCEVVALVQGADPQSELYRCGDIQRLKAVDGNLEDLGTLHRAINDNEVDTVFHLGAQTIVGTAQRFPLATFEANIRGTYNLMEVCRQHSGLVERVVIASSDKAYGEAAALPYTEEMPLNARNPYDLSKACADMIAQCYHQSYGLPVAILRCGNVYGGGDLNWSRIVPGTIRSIARGERPIIRSDGAYLRDYIYVKDVARAYLCVAECLQDQAVPGEAFNVSIESPLTVMDMVQAIGKAMDVDGLEPVVLDQAQGEIRDQHLSAAKARQILGWDPQYSLQKGLSETVRWYREFLS